MDTDADRWCVPDWRSACAWFPRKLYAIYWQWHFFETLPDGALEFYTTEFYGLQLNGTLVEKDVSIESSMLRPRTVAVDSGSSLLLLDPKSIDALRTYLQTQHGGLPGVLVNTTDTGSTFPSIFSASVYAPESSCLVLSEDYDWSAWPSIELLLDAVTISIPAPLYFIEALPNMYVLAWWQNVGLAVHTWLFFDQC